MASKQVIDRSNLGVAVSGGNVNIAGNVNCSSQEPLQLEEFNIPSLIKTFRGREKEMKKLNDLFFVQKKRKIVVCGLPGHGKTELSKQYAEHCCLNKNIDKVIWVEAENQDNLRKSLVKLRRIYNEFKGNTKILFIFDNATSRQAIFDYEPPKDENYFLLITSIEADWDDDVVPFKLDPLSSESVLEVYKSILTNNYQDDACELYQQLADIVGNIPLGIQIIGAYIRRQNNILGRKCDLKLYIEDLKQSQNKIITLPMPRGTANTYDKSIYGAIKISLDKISNEEDTKLRELALNILYVSCYLDPVNINFYYLLEMFNYSKLLIKNTNNKNKFRFALGLIENFCFVNVSTYSFSMHRLTQNVLRFHISNCDPQMQSKYYGMCLQYFIFEIPDWDWHVKHVISYADENIKTVQKYCEMEKKHLFKNKRTNKNLIIILTENGYINCLKTILNDTGNLAKEYIDENNLLHKAVRSNQLEIVKLLLQYGADIENKTYLGNTPIHEAAKMWSIDAIQVFLAHNADLNARNIIGDIPLFSLFRIIDSEIPEIKLTKKMLQIKFKCVIFSDDMKKEFIENNYYLPMLPSKSLNSELVNSILDALKCNDNKKIINDYGQTLLHIVATTCNEYIVKLLINKYNMDVNVQDFKGRTPLYYLILRPMSYTYGFKLSLEKVVATARILIMHGAKLNVIDGGNLIELADTNVDVYADDNHRHELTKQNIIMISLCDDRYIKELKQVFDYLGDRAKEYITEMKFLQYAVHSNQIDILKLLLQYDVDINQIKSPSLLQIAAFLWSRDSIKLLLQHNADLMATDRKRETALFHFVRGAHARNNFDIDIAIEILDLLKIEDQINVTNRLGATLLHTSAALFQEELVTLLVKKYKMKTNVKDRFGDTPMNVLIRYLDTRDIKKKRVINIVKVLQDYNDYSNDDAICTLLQSLTVKSRRYKKIHEREYCKLCEILDHSDCCSFDGDSLCNI